MLLTYKSKVSYVNVLGRRFPNTMHTIVQMCETMFIVCARWASILMCTLSPWHLVCYQFQVANTLSTMLVTAGSRNESKFLTIDNWSKDISRMWSWSAIIFLKVHVRSMVLLLCDDIAIDNQHVLEPYESLRNLFKDKIHTEILS